MKLTTLNKLLKEPLRRGHAERSSWRSIECTSPSQTEKLFRTWRREDLPLSRLNSRKLIKWKQRSINLLRRAMISSSFQQELSLPLNTSSPQRWPKKWSSNSTIPLSGCKELSTLVRSFGKIPTTRLVFLKSGNKFSSTLESGSWSYFTWNSSSGSPTWRSKLITLLTLQVQSVTPCLSKLDITNPIQLVQRSLLGSNLISSKKLILSQDLLNLFVNWECQIEWSLTVTLHASAKRKQRWEQTSQPITQSSPVTTSNSAWNGVNTLVLATELFLSSAQSSSRCLTSRWESSYRKLLKACSSLMRPLSKNGLCNTYSGSCTSLLVSYLSGLPLISKHSTPTSWTGGSEESTLISCLTGLRTSLASWSMFTACKFASPWLNSAFRHSKDAWADAKIRRNATLTIWCAHLHILCHPYMTSTWDHHSSFTTSTPTSLPTCLLHSPGEESCHRCSSFQLGDSPSCS